MLQANRFLGMPALEWGRQERFACIAILGFIIAFSHGVFELTFDKKAGVPFLREAVVAIVFAFTAYLLLKYPAMLRFKLSVAVLIYVVFFIFLSAVFSWWWFGQPPKYALMEERRVLGMLWFFPAFWFVLKSRPSESEINRGFMFAGAALAAFSLLYYFGVLADNEIPADIFIEQHFYADDDPRNQTRYVLGSGLLMVVIPFLILTLASRRFSRGNLWPLSILAASVFTLLMIDQSRSLLIGTLLAALGALVAQTSPRWKPVLVVAAVVGVLAIVAVLMNVQNEKTQWLIDSLFNGQGVRSQTSQIIWTVMRDTYFWGHGALSIQYNRGFLAVYNENFWLYDVGKLGLLYRFGFLSILFVIFYLYVLRFFFHAKKAFRDWPIMHALFWVYLVTLLVPWGSVLTLLPAELGIVFGLVVNRENRACR